MPCVYIDFFPVIITETLVITFNWFSLNNVSSAKSVFPLPLNVAHLCCSSARFEGSLNMDLNEIAMNLVPFPRLHYLVPSLTPLYTLADVNVPPRRSADWLAAIFCLAVVSSATMPGSHPLHHSLSTYLMVHVMMNEKEPPPAMMSLIGSASDCVSPLHRLSFKA